MKVILYMAISLNGIIAGKNNEEDFISHDCWSAWLELIRKHGSMVWGRKTHQVVKTWPKAYFDDIKGIKTVVVSRDRDYIVGPGFELANSPQAALKTLEKQGFKSVILSGGSRLNSAFAKLGLIDEIILNVEPVIEGKGIPLFKPDIFELKLELISMKQSKGKTIQLRYKVVTR
jgi:dihydrofolate reductase